MAFIDTMMDQQQQPPPALDENAIRQAMLARAGSSPSPLATPPFFPGAPTLPSSPRNGSTAGAGGAASSPVSSDPAYPATAPSSGGYVDRMAADRAALDTAQAKSAGLPNAPERANLWNDPNHGHLRTLLTVLAGGIQGGITGDIRQGMHVMEPALQQPQQEADRRWQTGQTTAQRDYENAIQKFNVDLAQKREQDVADERTATEKDRTADRAEREKDRQTQLETQRRNEKREEARDLQAAQDRAATTARETERDKATEKHWSDDIALRRQEMTARIKDAKDAKEGVPVLRAYTSDLTGRLNEIDKRLTAIQGNATLLGDKESEQEIKDLRAERVARQQELSDVEGLMKKHLGLEAGVSGAGSSVSPPMQQYTVSAPGKPPVQKSLTQDQVNLLKSSGVQLTPVQQAAKKKSAPQATQTAVQ